MQSPFRFVFLGLINLIICLGVYELLINMETNECDMTYMFEWPEYLKVPLDDKVHKRFPAYGLYLYGEGKYAREFEKFKLKGIPVLFIPGNAGSYKQVRSLGSVALRMAESTGSKFHFNYFSVDFNEELSGLFGGNLYHQTKFVNECIKTILDLYKDMKKPPQSVVLVGHSMGGMVARALFALPGFDRSLVHTIITQATPHQSPVISLDHHMAKFYDDVNSFWQGHGNTSLKDVVVMTTGGGDRDVLVRTGLTSLVGIAPLDRSISTSTKGIPRAWVSADHLCHVWCKQVILATKRAMFDMVDRNTGQMAANSFYRSKALEHHFYHNPGPPRFKAAYDKDISLQSSVRWELRQRKSWKFFNKVNNTRYSVVPLPVEHSAVVISNIENEGWVGVCKLAAKEERCFKIKNLSPYANIVPPVMSLRKIALLRQDQLEGQSHLVTVLPKSNKEVELFVEVFNSTARHVGHKVTSFASIFLSEPIVSPALIINRTEYSAIFYNFSLYDLELALQAYTIHLVNLGCNANMSKSDHAGALMEFYVPWTLEKTYSFVPFGESGNISISLNTGKPLGFTKNAELRLYLHPSCTYRVFMNVAWPKLPAQFIRLYGSLLPTFVMVQLLLSFGFQFRALLKQDEAPDLSEAHAKFCQPWRVVPLALLLRFMLNSPSESSLAQRLGLPRDDATILTDLGIWYAALPIFLYLVAHSFLAYYSAFLRLFLSLVGRFLVAVLTRFSPVFHIPLIIQFIPYSLMLAGVLISAFVCGAAGLVLVHFVLVFKVMVTCVASHLLLRERGLRLWGKFHLLTTLHVILLLSLTLQLPALISWEKNLGHSWTLPVDPSQFVCVCLGLAMLLLVFHIDYPVIYPDVYDLTFYTLYGSSVVLIMYAIHSLHRMNSVTSTTLLALSLPLAFTSILYCSGRLATVPLQRSSYEGDLDEPKEGKEAAVEETEGKDTATKAKERKGDGEKATRQKSE